MRVILTPCGLNDPCVQSFVNYDLANEMLCEVARKNETINILICQEGLPQRDRKAIEQMEERGYFLKLFQKLQCPGHRVRCLEWSFTDPQSLQNLEEQHIFFLEGSVTIILASMLFSLSLESPPHTFVRFSIELLTINSCILAFVEVPCLAELVGSETKYLCRVLASLVRLPYGTTPMLLGKVAK